ncbi:MAG TPA: hypothetical protein VHR66_29900 [Gemmataceae bacterium]|jgi:hypothetical protein|nr:hypothetical protein [Gemmataceae bacterium]
MLNDVHHIDIDPTQHDFAAWLGNNFLEEVKRVVCLDDPTLTVVSVKIGTAGEMYIGCTATKNRYQHHPEDWL